MDQEFTKRGPNRGSGDEAGPPPAKSNFGNRRKVKFKCDVLCASCI